MKSNDVRLPPRSAPSGKRPITVAIGLFLLTAVTSTVVACSASTEAEEVPSGPGASIEAGAPADGSAPPATGPQPTTPPPPTTGCPALAAPPGAETTKRLSADGFSAETLWATVDSKGRSVVGGWATTPASPYSVVFATRTLASGAVDTSFGTGGTALIDVGNLAASERGAFTLDAKDRIVIVARVRLSATNVDTFVARLAEDGKLDASFGPGGLVRGLVYDKQTDTNGLAVATVGTSTFVYAAITRVLPEKIIVGFHLDETGNKLPYDFTMPNGKDARLDTVRAASGGGGLFVGNKGRIYKLTAAGSIDASFGTTGYVDEPHTFLSPLRNGSLVVALQRSFKILPPTGLGASISVPPDIYTLLGVVERCDGTLVVATGDDNADPVHSVLLLGADGKAVAGHPRVTFTPSPDFMLRTVPAIDPSTGLVTLFGRGGQDGWLAALRVRP